MPLWNSEPQKYRNRLCALYRKYFITCRGAIEHIQCECCLTFPDMRMQSNMLNECIFRPLRTWGKMSHVKDISDCGHVVHVTKIRFIVSCNFTFLPRIWVSTFELCNNSSYLAEYKCGYKIDERTARVSQSNTICKLSLYYALSFTHMCYSIFVGFTNNFRVSWVVSDCVRVFLVLLRMLCC